MSQINVDVSVLPKPYIGTDVNLGKSIREVPGGGTEGQILTKEANGYGWQDPDSAKTVNNVMYDENRNISLDAEHVPYNNVLNVKLAIDNKAGFEDVYTREQADALLDKKVDKEEGKGLSSNDYTDAEKEKLAHIEPGGLANKIEKITVNHVLLPIVEKTVNVNVPTKNSQLINDTDYQSGALVKQSISVHNTATDAHADIRSALATETTERIVSDAALQLSINDETAARLAADILLQENIDAETTARILADTELSNRINTEKSERQTADSILQEHIDAEALARAQADTVLDTKIEAETTRATEAEQVITTALNTHINDKENPHSVTKAQVDLSDVVNKPMDNTPTTDSLNYITSGGVKAYVDTYGGKIDSITVNGEESVLPIENKNVTIPNVSKNGTPITLTNNNFNVEVPTKTSGLTNDGDGTSPFSTLSEVSGAINTHDTSEVAHAYIRELITTESVTRGEADTALGGRIDTESLTRSEADITLQENIDTEASTRSNADTALGGRIDSEAEARGQADTALGKRIDTEELTRGLADTALGKRIDTEELTRGQADTALGKRIDSEALTRGQADEALLDNIDAEALARGNADTGLSDRIDAEERARIAADNLRVLYTDIIDNTTTAVANKVLSANMGKELQDLINNLKSVGRFLSNWNAVTGLPTTDPTTSPYTYHAGDYYLVSVVSTSDPKVNYRPYGSSYTKGVPSTTKETKELNVGDYYVYDSTQWILLSNTLKTVTFENIAGDPYDNANLSTALNAKESTANKVTEWSTTTTDINYPSEKLVKDSLDGKVTKNSDITGATHTKITYDSKGLVTSGADLSASDIPNLTLSKITDVTATATEVNVLDGITATTLELNYVDGVTSNIQTQLNNRVEKNNAITGGTHTKITYDSKGLVTGGADLQASDIPNLTLSKITDVTATAAEVNILDGITATTLELNYSSGVTSNILTQLNNKSKVTVASTGTSTTLAKYLTIDGAEYKVSSDAPTEQTTILEEDLYTYANIGKITGASATNPVKVANAGDPLKIVFNSILGTETDSNPTINQGGTTFTKSGQTGTTSVSGAEIGQSISALTGSVTFTVTNTATCSYGLKAGSYDTYNKKTATTFNYPIKTRTISTYSYQVRIKYPTLNGCTLSVTAGTLVWNDTANSYLYCNVDANNKVTVSIAIPANTSTASAITRFGQLEADVDFDSATYQGVVVDNFWTYLKNSYTASGKTHAAITGVKSTAYTITAGTRYAYSKVTSSTTIPTSSLTKQAAESTFGTNGADFSYNLGDYIYMYRTVSGRTVLTYVLGQWANVDFTALPATTITQNNGATCTYYPYRVGPMEATGSAKYRV